MDNIDSSSEQSDSKASNKQAMLEVPLKDAVNKYYKLKSEYETNYNKMKTRIISTKGLGWREKRHEFKQLKPKCINCKRPVGSIFSRSVLKSENGLNNYIIKAMCGDRAKPCKLNIEISLGDVKQCNTVIKDYSNEITKYKLDIITMKNNLLFGYASDKSILLTFDELKEKLSEALASHQETIEHCLLMSNNKTNDAELKTAQLQLAVQIEDLKALIKQYDTTLEEQFINDAVSVYVNDMMPTMTKILDNYAYCEVEYDENIYTLVQSRVNIAKLEMNRGDIEDGVIAYSV